MTVKDRPSLGFFNDPMLRRFFGEEFGDQARPRQRRAESLGSGVIVSPEGYVLTANHVVEGAESVTVALAAGDREFEAKIIGTDPPTDIAVLKVEAKKPLPAITLGDSDKLEVGDLAIAVGNPFRIGQTVTAGIISGLGRGSLGINDYENFIQTDAAINPGNSGGALVDAEGRLVGINTAILSGSGGFQGVGFAVPINLARYVMERLVKEGKVTRGYLGVNIQPLSADLAKAFDLPDESSGVLVGGVSPRSAAQKAGVRDGDVIVEFNGRKVADPATLRLFVAQTPPGSKATLKVLRTEGSDKPTEKLLNVTLAELPSDETAAKGRSQPAQQGNSDRDALDGVEVVDLDAATRREAGIPSDVQGALVTKVAANSNSADAGVRPGDVIVSINRKTVRSADDAVALSEQAKGDRILVRVWSRGAGDQGGTRYLTVDNAPRKNK
jgi:serine protease Do